MTAWFKRTEKGIQTATEQKKDTPKGLWYKSPTGKIVESEELAKNFYVSPEDDYHVRIGSKEYFEILFDNNKFQELDAKLTSKDPLKFEDTKKYSDRLKAAQKKTGLKDAFVLVEKLGAADLDRQRCGDSRADRCGDLLAGRGGRA